MKSLVIILILYVFFASILYSQDFKWDKELGYQDRLLFIHPFVNYDYNAYWYYDWEKNYFSGNGFLYSVGSVTTHELLVDGHLVINQSLGAGWRFRGEGRWSETLHHQHVVKRPFMGLEKQVVFNTSLYLIVNPAYSKEFTDLNFGILYADSTYENYLRVGLLWEDFVYDDKNDRDGVSDQVPYALQWYGRYEWNKFVIYSQGRWSQGFKRRYPNEELSSFETSHNQKYSHGTLKLYYTPNETSILNVSLYHYRFDETKSFYADSLNYTYKSDITDIGIDYLLTLKDVNRFRLQLHYVTMNGKSLGYREHLYERADFLSAISYERFLDRHIIELQYMFAIPSWDYQSFHELEQPTNTYSGSMDKVKIGWTYQFPLRSQIHISVSHEVQAGNFGGANLQYILLF